MAAITAAMVKELREKTLVGMADCKNALVEADGDFDRAADILREKGLAAASKKAGRIAAEGLVSAVIADDNTAGVVVEVNSETDFVAKNQEFKNYVAQVAAQIMQSSSTTIDDFMNEKWIENTEVTVKEALSQKIAVIGENLSVRRFEKYVNTGKGALVSYIHGGGKVAVMIELETETVSDAVVEAGKNVCMQIAAMSPRFVSRADVPEEFVEKEREILRQQTLNEGRPEAIVDKIVIGRLNKELKDFCLVDQEYVKDSDMTVGQYLDSVSKEIGTKITAKRFVRYETGEGLAKKEEDFAAEVSKAING